MKVKDAINYNHIIKSIIDNSTDVSALVKFRFLGVAKQLEAIEENFKSIRNEKIEKYGTVDETGNLGIFTPKREDYEDDAEFDKAQQDYADTVNKLNSELKDVLDDEADVEIKKFKYTDIIDAGLSADYLVALYDFIEE